MSAATVLIVDDHLMVRSTLVMALAAHGLRATAIGPEELCSRLGEPAPPGGLVLLDLDLGDDLDGVRLVPDLRRAGWRVVIVTGSTDEARLARAVAGGAAGWVSKAAPFEDLVAQALRAADGRQLIDEAERARLHRVAAASERAAAEAERKWSQLTRRELEVAGCLAAGMRPTAIAEHSFTSVSTVRTQIKSILAKLEVTSQLEVAALAHRRGVRPPTGSS